MQHSVVIAGAGPTGLTLAAELALAKIDVAIVEPRASQELFGTRARGLHCRTIELLDQRGIADRFVSEGQTYPLVHFHVPLEFGDFPTRHNYLLGLKQHRVEQLLANWVEELEVPIYRENEVVDFDQDSEGVNVGISTGESLEAQYLVGCDGGRSRIRKLAGIDLKGWDPTTSWLLAEARTAEEQKWGFHEDFRGIHAIGKSEDDIVNIVLTEAEISTDNEPTLDDVRRTLDEIYGTDFGVHSAVHVSRFTDLTLQAESYRNDRVLIAGDAAHIHPPLGGQGLNLGMQDAMNLGWKLAQVVKGISPQALLDTYCSERNQVAARVLRNTMALTALRGTDERTKAVAERVTEMLRMAQPRKHFAADMSGLAIRYELGSGNAEEEHPLLGRRMPDVDLYTDAGPRRAFEFLHEARPVFFDLGLPAALDISPWEDRVKAVNASSEVSWELPAFDDVAAPRALLVRPDGYVAWTDDQGIGALSSALNKWFGPP